MNHNRFVAFIAYVFAASAAFAWFFLDPPFQKIALTLLGFVAVLFAPLVALVWLSDHQRAKSGDPK